jgi:hypothetical protein
VRFGKRGRGLALSVYYIFFLAEGVWESDTGRVTCYVNDERDRARLGPDLPGVFWTILEAGVRFPGRKSH